MTKDQAIAHFGTSAALARALRIKPPAITDWGKYPPALRQLQLEAVTFGVLKAEKHCIPRRAKT